MTAAATLPKAWLARCQAQPQQVAMRHKRHGIWQSVRWSEYLASARGIGLALHRLGLAPGDVVSIVSESRPEWLFADMAAQAMGLLSHAVYPTCPPARMTGLLALAGTRVAFVENVAQAAMILAVADRLPKLAQVVVFDERGLRQLGDPRAIGLAAFTAGEGTAADGLFEQRIAGAHAHDLAVLTPTAGAGAEPRIAAFSHAAVLAQAQVLRAELSIAEGDRMLCFTPLANATERVITTVMPVLCQGLAHFPESPATVVNDLREVEPDWVHAPPRFWEKLQARTESAALRSAQRARRLYRRSVDGDGAGWLQGAARRQLRRGLGLGRVRQVFSAGAPLAPSLTRWYQAIGVPMRELYEAAETCGAVALNGDSARLQPDGELLLKPPARLAGYWRHGELQPARLTHDGWLCSGDLGAMDAEGGLRVLGKRVDAFVSPNGWPISPGPLEGALQGSAFIATAMLVGAQRNHCACLLSLEEESLFTYAQSQGIPFTDYASLVDRSEVHALVQAEIDHLNASLAEPLRIQAFGLLPFALTAGDDVMTPTLRIQRRAATQRFADRIESLYIG